MSRRWLNTRTACWLIVLNDWLSGCSESPIQRCDPDTIPLSIAIYREDMKSIASSPLVISIHMVDGDVTIACDNVGLVCDVHPVHGDVYDSAVGGSGGRVQWVRLY